MKINEFREAVIREFGPNMENATPANVREFLDRVQLVLHEDESLARDAFGRLVLNEHATSYEQILREFFSGVLKLPNDEAVITLWIMALEMSYSALETQYADIFRRLFPDRERE